MYLPLPTEPPVFNIISRPYEGKIPNFRDMDNSIDRLSTLTHEINPDYLLFHPSINSIQNVWFLASYGSAWLFGQSFFIFIFASHQYLIVEQFELISLFPLFSLTLFLIAMGFGPFFTLRQLKLKRSKYHKLLFLKKTQQVAYYQHKKKNKQIFHLIDYKDITASVRRNEGLVYEVLNLHVIDATTGEASLTINFEDMRLNPYDQWTFIRTYMERPAQDLELKPEYAHACPTDMSQSLFACADIVQATKAYNYRNPKHEVRLIDWLRACVVSFLDLAEGNIYQSSKNPALHPEVQSQLTWNDSQPNPYNTLPLTAERKAAFNNQNKKVKLKWYSAIAINLTWFIGSILYVMLVIA